MSNKPYDFRTDAMLKMVMFWGEWLPNGTWKYGSEKFVRYAYNGNLTKEGKPKYHGDIRKNDTGDFDRALAYLESEYEKHAPILMPHYTIFCDNGYSGKGTGTIYAFRDTKPPKPEIEQVSFLLKAVCYTLRNEKKNFYSANADNDITSAMMSIVAQVVRHERIFNQPLQPIGYLYGGEKLYKFGEEVPKYPAWLCTKSQKVFYNGTRRKTKAFELCERTENMMQLEMLLSDMKNLFR